MSVLDSIIEGVREDLAARRLPMSQLLEAIEVAPPVRDCLSALLTEDIPNNIELMPDKATITSVCENIHLIYKQIKKKERKYATNIEKESTTNTSLQKMDMVNSITFN